MTVENVQDIDGIENKSKLEENSPTVSGFHNVLQILTHENNDNDENVKQPIDCNSEESDSKPGDNTLEGNDHAELKSDSHTFSDGIGTEDKLVMETVSVTPRGMSEETEKVLNGRCYVKSAVTVGDDAKAAKPRYGHNQDVCTNVSSSNESNFTNSEENENIKLGLKCDESAVDNGPTREKEEHSAVKETAGNSNPSVQGRFRIYVTCMFFLRVVSFKV